MIEAPGKAGATGNLFFRFCALLSQAINLIFFNGSPDETLSARSYRLGDIQGRPEWIRRRKKIDRLFWFQPDHCRTSHEEDVAFARVILDFEATRERRPE